MKIKKICQQCGKCFYWQPSTRHHKGKYCSKECRIKKGSNWQGGIWINCDFCGKKIYRQPYQLRLKNHFCSNSCHINYQIKKQYFLEKTLYLRLQNLIRGREKLHKLWLKQNNQMLFNYFKNKLFKNIQLTDLDKKVIEAKILIHKIRRAINEQNG